MALWANTDDAANSTIFAAAQVHKTPNTANQTALFGNTTQDAFISGVAVGQFGVSVEEMEVARAKGEKPAAAGWVLRTEGSGGRAGRVFSETLVAMKTIGGDAEDVGFPDFVIVITEQPVDQEVLQDETATFTVDYATTDYTVNIQWQVSDDAGTSWGNITGETGFDLVVANTAPEYVDGNLFRAVLTSDDADTVTSDVATLTITSA